MTVCNRTSGETEVVDEVASQVDELTLDVQSCLDPSGIQNDIQPRGADLRVADRFPVTCPVIAIPLRGDGRPDETQRVDGTIRDASIRGIGAVLAGSDSDLSDGLLIGVRSANGEYRYAGVELRHLGCTDEQGINVGGEFGGKIQEILESGTVVPIFQPDRMEFVVEYATPLLESLQYLGVLQEMVIDRIQLCPKCHGLPTFRQGCRKCGSARFATDRLVHHFPCAHVGPIADFETPQGLVCPKCRTRHLIAGADFEYLTGQYHCLVCHANDTELEQVGHCVRCGFRFSGHQSIVQDVKGFHAHRLDPLDLLPAP